MCQSAGLEEGSTVTILRHEYGYQLVELFLIDARG